MMHRIWYIGVLLLMGLAWGVRAETVGELSQKRKPPKLTVNVVKQQDGSIIERLDMSTLSGQTRDEGIPTTPAEWLARMIDPTRQGLVVKRPQLFAEWLDAVTEPRFMTAVATVVLDPGTYPKTLSRLADPAAARNWAEFVDPELFMRWMAVGLDPKLYQAVFRHMADPKKYLRWAAFTNNLQSSPAWPSTAAVGTGTQPPASGSSASNPISAQEWLQLPTQDLKINPWLAHTNPYRD